MIRRSSIMNNQIHRRRSRPRGRRWLRMGVLAALAALCPGIISLTLWGCRPTAPPGPGPGFGVAARPAAASGGKLSREPHVRIRIPKAGKRITFAGKSKFRVTPGTAKPRTLAGPVTVQRSSSSAKLSLHRGDNRPAIIEAAVIELSSTNGKPIRIGKAAYPGSIVLYARSDGDGFDVVNHVLIEQYLPGVLDRELYRHWQPVTYQAQAIAARSYAIAEQGRTRRRHFDLESTQASQVYGGVTANAKARRAVRRTRGTVLTYGGSVLPAYYSSCTGGRGQDAAAAFPNAPDIPPLRGRYHGAWGSASRYYHWGPIQRQRSTLSNRIAAWGRRKGHAVAALTSIRSITISRYNAVNRPTAFTITDAGSATYQLGAETFRFACNFDDASLPKLTSAARLRSSFTKVTVAGRYVTFSDGRGFGHGVGMDQHGAQAMAQRGHNAGSILAFYYPEAKLVKAY